MSSVNSESIQDNVTRFFDEQAVDYDGKYEHVTDMRSFIFSERKRIVLDMLSDKFDRILDIGCGPGVYTDKLIGRCRELYGVDISEEMISLAKAKGYPRTTYSVGSIDRLSFSQGYFDGVVCVGVLEYLDDIEAAVMETSRVLRNGGVAVFTAPNASSVLNKIDYAMRWVLKACKRYLRIDLARSFMNYDFQPTLISSVFLETLLKKHGFAVEARRFHIFRLSFLNRISPRLTLSIARKLNFVVNRYMAINYIVKARKVDAAH